MGALVRLAIVGAVLATVALAAQQTRYLKLDPTGDKTLDRNFQRIDDAVGPLLAATTSLAPTTTTTTTTTASPTTTL